MAVLAQSVAAQEERKTFAISEIQAAQLLIASNRLDDATHLLERMLALSPDERKSLFLLATIAVAHPAFFWRMLRVRNVRAGMI